MNKKNTGATLGVLVAVSIGATAYASAMTNLDKDTNTKALLENKVSYVEPSYKAKLNTVEANYTKEVENTKIGESYKELAITESDENATLYESLTEEVVENDLVFAEEEVDTSEEKLDEEMDKSEEKLEEEINEKDLKEDSSDLTEEDKDLEAKKEEKIENDSTEVDKDQDDIEEIDEEVEEVEEIKESEEVKESEENFQIATYSSNNELDLEEAETEEEKEEPVVEEKIAEKYVNVEFLNVRSDASTEADIVNTIQAGEKLSGKVEGEWLNTDSGFVKVDFLSDSFPEDLVDKIEDKKLAAEEAQKKAEEEKKKEEEAQRKAAEEKKQAEEAQKRAEEEKKQAEQAQKEAEENKAVDYTGWVNTPGLNVRSNASTDGNIVGTLTKGDKVSGVLQNGWIKINFNGGQGFISSKYIVDYEVEKPAPAPEQTNEAPQNNQQAQETQEVVKEAPIANGSGQAAANIAQQFNGYPYVFGASNPSVGFDCSGLVHYAYSQVGVNLSRNSAAQFSNGYAVDSSNLVPGDLVFFSYGGGIDHVGIITGYDGTFIHASTPGTGVVYGNIYSSHYQSVFQGARRIF